MPNGHDPPRELDDTKYQTIKSGSVVLSGPYEGCIKVGVTHYWIAPAGSYWALNQGEPDETQTMITAAVWDLCKDGGTYTWNATGEYWESGRTDYRWAGDSGEDVHLVEL